MQTLLNTRGLLPLTTYADGRCELWWHPKLDRVYLDTHRGGIHWQREVVSEHSTLPPEALTQLKRLRTERAQPGADPRYPLRDMPLDWAVRSVREPSAYESVQGKDWLEYRMEHRQDPRRAASLFWNLETGEVRWWTHVSSQDRNTTGLACPWRETA